MKTRITNLLIFREDLQMKTNYEERIEYVIANLSISPVGMDGRGNKQQMKRRLEAILKAEKETNHTNNSCCIPH